MRSDGYRFQARSPKIQRQQSSSRYQQLAKVSSYTPGHWKSYIPHQINLSSQKRSQRMPSYHTPAHPTPYRNSIHEPTYEHQQSSRVNSILTTRKQQERRRHESAIKKVRELQEKVLPMVKGERGEQEQKWTAWQNRIEQRLMRLEGNVENAKKQMQLQLQRRLAQVQNKWMNKINTLQQQISQR